MKKVIVTQPFLGIWHMQVCAESQASDEEILDVCNTENPSGTSLGWCKVIRQDEGNLNPVQCADYADRTHFIIAC